jgi:hypothetical protein
MLSLRKAAQVAVAMTTLAGMAPALAPAARPRTASAAKRCEWAAAHKAHLGAPLITDRRGSTVAVLFVDHRDNYERFCLYAPHNGVGTSSDIASPDSLNPAPGPSGIQHSSEGGSCDPTTRQAVGEMFGRVGANVTEATFTFPNGKSIPATVKNGFYVVWWAWDTVTHPNQIILKTKTGTTSEIQMDAGLTRTC